MNHNNLTYSAEQYTERFGSIESKRAQIDLIKESDWDALLVFDACRVDAMEELMKTEGHGGLTEVVETPTTTATTEWAASIWSSVNTSDITYIAGNPAWKMARDVHDFDLESEVDELIDAASGDVIKGDSAWSRYLKATRPDVITEMAREAEPPVVVHYLQPHTPFIGDIRIGTVKSDHRVLDSIDTNRTTTGLAEAGHITTELYRAGYVDNLHVAWQSARQLLPDFDSIALTSDHGEMLGPNDYSHGEHGDPRHTLVPWVEL